MNAISPPRWALAGLLALTLLIPSWAGAEPTFKRIVVFGTSLSDPGNAFALAGHQSTLPYANLDELLIPDAPYARGGHHFSNGATWIEQLARPLGLAEDAGRAFRDPTSTASNFAVGGTRARDTGSRTENGTDRKWDRFIYAEHALKSPPLPQGKTAQ